jgi:Alr-MurF fusion protein
MMAYSVNQIIKPLKAKIIQNNQNLVRYLLTDSRTMVSPGESIFFALVGERNDGHTFIPELYQRGVRNFVVSEYPANFDTFSEANFFIVKDTLEALQLVAAYHRRKFLNPVVAITGSNGKTIVKEWIYQTLQGDRKVIRSPKSYNSQIGVPLSVWLLDDEYDIALIEAGISKPAEMDKLEKIIQPEIGIFTNIGEAHQENFKDIEQKVNEKLKLFKGCKTLIYCRDHKIIDNQVKKVLNPDITSFFTWAETKDADLRITKINNCGNATTTITGIFESREIEICIPFTDRASTENAIDVWAFLLYMKYDNAYIKDKIKNLSQVAMRLELKHGINHCTIINDSYNSDLISLSIALDFLNQQQQHVNKTLILSDILQSGKSDEDLYKEVAELVHKKKIQRIIGIGKGISAHSKLFSITRQFFPSTDAFIAAFSREEFNEEAILIKGSRNFGFERISHLLEQKAHRTALEIDMNALVHNLNYFRSLLKPSTKMMVMVKAFSYGSGTYEIANLLQYQRTDYLAVAFADEGIGLRNAGISMPIMVLNPEINTYDLLIDYRLEPQIYSFSAITRFNEALSRKGIQSYPVHIKLDTGMHRLGFMEDETTQLIEALKQNERLKIRSTFTHLAGSDEPMHDAFTHEQIQCFTRMSDKLVKAFDYSILRHILNSAGIERFPEAQFDMVRLGIGIYGISAIDQSKVRNIGTLKSTISQIKKIKTGETIGYGRHGIAKKETTIAIVPIGYADGLNRKLSNGVGKFLINGKFAPIIGNICMDLCMVDISDIEAEEGDDVIVFGNRFTITDMANVLGTIPYEILTNVSSRVKRIYFQE